MLYDSITDVKEPGDPTASFSADSAAWPLPSQWLTFLIKAPAGNMLNNSKMNAAQMNIFVLTTGQIAVCWH